MTLDRNGWIAWWAYRVDALDERGFVMPQQTSVCALFWRCVAWTPVSFGMFAIFLVIVSPILLPVLAWDGLYRRVRGRNFDWDRIGSTAKNSVLVQGAVAWKRKVCPFVEIK